jgi:WhiB family redox-sensing transcriptional regulator
MNSIPYPSFTGKGVRKCLLVEDLNIFFAEADMPGEPEGKKMTAEAKSVCQTCPYMVECGAYAIANPEERGVWGGLSEEDRRQFRRRQTKRGYSLANATRDTP